MSKGKVSWSGLDAKKFCKHPGCKECTKRCQYNDNFAMRKSDSYNCRVDKFECNNSR